MHKIYLDKRISNKKTKKQLYNTLPTCFTIYQEFLERDKIKFPRYLQISSSLKKKKNERDHYKQDLINFSINDSIKLWFFDVITNILGQTLQFSQRLDSLKSSGSILDLWLLEWTRRVHGAERGKERRKREESFYCLFCWCMASPHASVARVYYNRHGVDGLPEDRAPGPASPIGRRGKLGTPHSTRIRGETR